MKKIERSIEINNKTLSLEFGRLAQQSTSSVLARLGDTCVLVTVVAGKQRDDIDFFPLSVEYQEKLYAGGRIKGSRWVKKEGRPTDDAILKGRLIDRSIRPLFPKNYRRDVQIVVTTLAVDGVHSSDIVGSIAVSAALHVSSIPFAQPISTMRVGYMKDDSGTAAHLVNPTEDEQDHSLLDLIVSSTKEKVVMLETEAMQLSESIVEEGIKLAKEENGKIIEFIEGLRSEFGAEKEVVAPDTAEEDLHALLKSNFQDDLNAILDTKASKESSDPAILANLVDKVMDHQGDAPTHNPGKVAGAIDSLIKKMIKDRILDTKTRIDGRSPTQVRNLRVEVGILPRVHGTGLFNRGDTQVLSIATLGAPSMTQLIESPEGEEERFYMHHYNMPPYTVGETGRVGFSSRREIGHGALAEKAIRPVLPTPEEFPYTIRVVSEVLSSNGSTSMASTCGSSLALMDAAVPIKAPVAGIAMGLVSRSDDDYVILTDIMGIEDFSGEMDFKVTGTKEGVTAIQLDVKNDGLTEQMIREILDQATTARNEIHAAMDAVLPAPRTKLSEHAPKVVVLHPQQDKIGEIIGPGGKNIRSMIAKTNTDINISDEGEVVITGVDQKGVDEAVRMIELISKEVEVDEEFEGVVQRILPFGAFVEILPGKEGLVHISKMSKEFVKDPNEVVKIGQHVNVRVLEIDKQGRINLTMLSQ